MDFYPHDPFELSPELRQIAEILDLPEILEPFISVYEEAIKENKLTSDNTTVIESIEQFTETTGQKPREGAYDRGGYSRSVEEACLEKGVRLAIPKVGKKDATRRDYERKAWFKKLQRWRAGVEGKISVLKRRYGGTGLRPVRMGIQNARLPGALLHTIWI